MNFYYKTIFFLLLFYFSALPIHAQDTIQVVNHQSVNSIEMQQKPYVVLISIDGLRWDLVEKYQAKNLLKLSASGVKADYLKSSYPSLTFPNHYTLVTGLYPAHHGVVDNVYFDKNTNQLFRRSDKKMANDSYWYQGKPIWVLAEEQKMLSAVFYWPGSEIDFGGYKPTYYYNYNEIIPLERRIKIINDWFHLPAERRPHFVGLYFPQVDHAAHAFSADSEQTKSALLQIDDAIGKIVENAEKTGLPINYIVVSDHGMVKVNQKETLPLPKEVDLKQFKVPPGSALLHLYANDNKFIKPTFKALKNNAKEFDVYLGTKTPKAWRYNKKEDRYNRIGDILLVPHLPKVFSIMGVKPELGQHGFDPALVDMRASFYAWGPQIKSGLQIAGFENVNVYPLVAKILGLTITHKVDGKLKILQPILK